MRSITLFVWSLVATAVSLHGLVQAQDKFAVVMQEDIS
jgi:hypothetical protein